MSTTTTTTNTIATNDTTISTNDTTIATTDTTIATTDTTDTTIDTIKQPFCPELRERLETRLVEMKQYLRDNARIVDLYGPGLTLKDYDEIIKEHYEKMRATEDPNEIELLEKEIGYFENDRSVLIEHTEKLNQTHQELIEAFSHPIDYFINRLTNSIYSAYQYLIDGIFESFVNKISKICPDDSDYKGTINGIYKEKESFRVTKLFNNLNQTLITFLSELIKSLGPSSIYSNDVDKFDSLDDLISDIDNGCWDIYRGILHLINVKISHFSSDSKLKQSLLAKSISRVLLADINTYIVKELPKKVEDKLKSFVKQISKNKLLPCDVSQFFGPKKESSTQSGSLRANGPEQLLELTNESDSPRGFPERSEEPVTTKSERPIISDLSDDDIEPDSVIKVEPEKTLDDFINTLPREPMDINQIVPLYNAYFPGKNIYSRSLGMILSKTNKFDKRRTTRNGQKTTLYIRK